MKALILFAIFSNVIGCTTTAAKQNVAESETITYFAVEPTPKTRVITYHVQPDNFSAKLQSEFDQTLANLSGKCWYWAEPSSRKTLEVSGPEYCLKFVNFTKISHLKPYKRGPTDKKMLLTALDQEDSIQVQNFAWDGVKLQRVRNSDSKLKYEGPDRLAKFMILWALK